MTDSNETQAPTSRSGRVIKLSEKAANANAVDEVSNSEVVEEFEKITGENVLRVRSAEPQGASSCGVDLVACV